MLVSLYSVYTLLMGSFSFSVLLRMLKILLCERVSINTGKWRSVAHFDFQCILLLYIRVIPFCCKEEYRFCIQCALKMIEISWNELIWEMNTTTWFHWSLNSECKKSHHFLSELKERKRVKDAGIWHSFRNCGTEASIWWTQSEATKAQK